MIINDQFYQQICKDLDQIKINETVGIEAPTGIGKTFSLLTYFSNSPKFKDVLFILPTRLACNQWNHNFNNLDKYPASYALDIIIKCKIFRYKTVIIDEVHIDSKEYYSIFLILKHLKTLKNQEITIILVSATIPEFYLSTSFFPNLRLLKYNHQHLYKTNVSYIPEDMSITYVNKGKILDLMHIKIIENYEKYNRILCFLSSHSDCEEIYNRIKYLSHYKPIFIFHGGLEKNEKTILKKEFETETKYIILSTNITESSVTIPNIDFVIDSCIECKLTYNTYITVYSSKMSLIQRAGRVGRTKNGSVLRLISEKNFNQDINEYGLNDHNLDTIYIKCFLSDLHPSDIFGMSILNDLNYLRIILDIDKNTKKHYLEFIDKSCLLPFSSILLYRLLKNPKFTHSEKLFIIVLIVILDFYDKKLPKWFYFDKTISVPSKKNILRRISKKFNIENDLLITQGRIFLSIFYSNDWKAYATDLHFNIKVLRDFFKLFFKTVGFSFGNNHDIKKNLNMIYQKNIIDIPYKYIEKARIFFWNNNMTNVNISKFNYYFDYDHFYKPGFNTVPENSLLNPFFTKNETLIPFIWTNCPNYFLDFQYQLEDRMRLQRFYVQTEKKTRENKTRVLHEIDNEVAYRPHNAGITRDIEELIVFTKNFNVTVLDTLSI